MLGSGNENSSWRTAAGTFIPKAAGFLLGTLSPGIVPRYDPLAPMAALNKRCLIASVLTIPRKSTFVVGILLVIGKTVGSTIFAQSAFPAHFRVFESSRLGRFGRQNQMPSACDRT